MDDGTFSRSDHVQGYRRPKGTEGNAFILTRKVLQRRPRWRGPAISVLGPQQVRQRIHRSPVSLHHTYDARHRLDSQLGHGHDTFLVFCGVSFSIYIPQEVAMVLVTACRPTK